MTNNKVRRYRFRIEELRPIEVVATFQDMNLVRSLLREGGAHVDVDIQEDDCWVESA